MSSLSARSETRPCLLGLLTLAQACGAREVTVIEWPPELEVAVVVRQAGEQYEALGVFTLEDQLPLGAPLAAVIDEGSNEGIELHGWTRAALLERLPELQLGEGSSLGVTRHEGGCQGPRRTAEGGWRVPLAALAPKSFSLAAGEKRFEPQPESRALSVFALEVPPGMAACGLPAAETVIDLEAMVLPPGATLLGRVPNQPRDPDLIYRQVLRVDESRILVQSYAGLFLFRRGERFADDEATRLSVAELPPRASGPPAGPGWSWSGIAVTERDPDGKIRRVFASASHGSTIGDQPGGGGIFEIDLDDRGFVRPVRTSTNFDRGPGPGAIAAIGDGSYVAVGADGTVFRKAAGETRVQIGAIEPRPWYRRVLATPHPTLRHVAGSETGHLAVGDFLLNFEQVRNTLLGEATTAVTGLAFLSEPEPRVAVGTFASGLWEVDPSGELQPLAFSIDESSTCASAPDECGLRTLDRSVLTAEGRDLLVASAGRCGDIVLIHRPSRCARPLPLDVETVTGMDLSGGLLTVVAEQGGIYEVPLGR